MIQEALIAGVSTRRVDELVQAVGKPPRSYCTRADPFESSSEKLDRLFEHALGRTGRDLFEQLCANNPGLYSGQHLRTFQRRQKQWRAERAHAMIFAAAEARDPIAA